MTDKDRADLYRAMRHAFGHESGGQHHHLNIEAFMRELERFVDAKITESWQKAAPQEDR